LQPLDGQVHHDTHDIPMGNYVIAVGNYVIVTSSQVGNYLSADIGVQVPGGAPVMTWAYRPPCT
jgi:hypothetical protein